MKSTLPSTPAEWRKAGLDREPILRLNQRLHKDKLVVSFYKLSFSRKGAKNSFRE